MLLVLLVVVALIGAVAVWLTRRRRDPPNAPRLFKEFPFIPWLGSIWQFAQEPSLFLQRGRQTMGEIFDVQLFGQKMTFLMSTEGHEFFFQQDEADFDAAAAYKFTVRVMSRPCARLSSC